LNNKLKLSLLIIILVILLGSITFAYIYTSRKDFKQFANDNNHNPITQNTAQNIAEQDENQQPNDNTNITKIIYGQSALGRDLEAFLINGIGNNSKTMFLDFEVHGFEDEYEKDGQVLVELANKLIDYYSANPAFLGDYKMIIVPSANPDGLIDGKNNYRASTKGAFGRCTAAGIDMNRDFKEDSFKAVESQYLRDLMNEYPMNIHIDFHGWEDSVIGNPTIVKAFRSEARLTTDKSNRYGSGQGYLIEYTKNTYGADSALVEFKNSSSVDATKVENALNLLMEQK